MKHFTVSSGGWKKGRPPKFVAKSTVTVQAENKDEAIRIAKNMSRRERLVNRWDPTAGKVIRAILVKAKPETSVIPAKEESKPAIAEQSAAESKATGETK